MNPSLSTIYRPTISMNPSTHNLSTHSVIPTIYVSVHPSSPIISHQSIYMSTINLSIYLCVQPANPSSISTIYPPSISTTNIPSINRSVSTLYHRPTYLSALSPINLPLLSINPATHQLSIHTSIHPFNHHLSIMSIYPPIQPASIVSLYPPIQPLSVYHVYLPTHSTIIYHVYLPTHSTTVCLSSLSAHTFNHHLSCR